MYHKPRDTQQTLYDGSTKQVWTRREVFANTDFPFGIRYAAPQDPHMLHAHKGFDELTVVHEGEGVHFTEDQEFLVRAGDVYIIKGNQRHGYKDLDNLCLRNVCFDPRQALVQTAHVKKLPGFHVLFSLEPKYRSAHAFESRLRLDPGELAHLMTLIVAMEQELEERAAGYEYTVTALFMQAVSHVCRCYAHASHPSSRSLMRMASVISHLEKHYAEPVELLELQKIARLSSSALLKRFKEATGVSPIEYLIRVRVSRAIELLRDNDTSITEAAYEAGFSDSNYFARQFRRIMGMSPSEYRERMLRIT